MAVTVVGLLEADLPDAIEYKEGGVGPLFREERTEEPIALYEFLTRSISALQKLGITDVVSCYVDEIELYRDADDDEKDDFDIVLREAEQATADGNGISFYLMLSHADKQLSHIITFEGSVDHPADEAALSVLDTARMVDGEVAGGEGDEEGDDDEEAKEQGFASDATRDKPANSPLQPIDDDVTFFDERAADAEDLVEAFLQRVLTELEKELGVLEPEIDVWTDWEGAYGLESASGPNLPGISG